MKNQIDWRRLFDATAHSWGRTLAICTLAAGSLTMNAVQSGSPISGGVISAGNQAVVSQQFIKGTVVDETGEPMVGVTVMAEGKAAEGTSTDLDGNFSLKASTGTTLTFSYIGYETVTAKAAPGMTVTMKSSSVELDEVVAIGYGTIKKRDLTGAVSSVKAEDIVRTPTGNVIEAIQGQVAGLDITRTNGEAGSGVNMTLRGARSINGDNNPLFIIDGIEGNYEELNPNDIASIEVLKGASSTAIYGSAGANGVIIITTKNPQKDRFTINFDGYYGWNTISEFPEMNTGQRYIDFRREAQRTAGVWNSPADDDKLFPSYMQKHIDAGNWVDWFDEASQTGHTQSYNLNTTYSNDRMDAMFSLGYYDVEGILKGDQLKRYSARTKLDFHANPYVNYGISLYAMYSDNDRRSKRIWNRVLNMPPLGDVYDENGKLVDYPIGDGNMNPIADSDPKAYVGNNKTISVTPQAYVELTPLKGLSVKSVLGGYFRSTKKSVYNGTHSYQALEKGLVDATIDNDFVYNYKWQNIITYNFDINRDHKFTVTGVTEWAKDRIETTNSTANGFDTDDYGYHNLSAATGTPSVKSSFTQTQKMSYAFRVNYSFMGRYLASVTSRWDGASILAKGHKWDVFPAGSLAWRISDEPFMRDLRWLNNLKLRAEYGVSGNAGASAYATLDYSRNGIIGFQDIAQAYSGYNLSVANTNLGWEKSYNVNIGLDAGFLNDRITFTLDWYRTDTKDLLFKKNLPYGNGGYGASPFNIWANVGETRNTGVELAVTSRNIVNRDFQWTTTLTFSTNRNKVIKTTSEGPLQFEDYYLIPGQPIHTYYGYKYLQIWGTDQAEEAAKYGQKPGQVRVAEQGDPDYKLNKDDYFVLGSADPKWSASLLNNFNYRNFDLSFLLIARWDWTIPYGLTGWFRTDGLSPSPAVCDYWTPENQSARYPRPDASVSNGQDPYQQWINYYDGSYLKVKNITLGYTLPRNLLNKFGVDKARFYFTASNPFIFTKSKYLKHYDPEKGGDDDQAPLSKQYVFGINLTF